MKATFGWTKLENGCAYHLLDCGVDPDVEARLIIPVQTEQEQVIFLYAVIHLSHAFLTDQVILNNFLVAWITHYVKNFQRDRELADRGIMVLARHLPANEGDESLEVIHRGDRPHASVDFHGKGCKLLLDYFRPS